MNCNGKYEVAYFIHEHWGLAGSLAAISVCIAVLLLVRLIHLNRWEIKSFFKKVLDKIKKL